MVEADRLLQANEIDAANSDLARVRSLKELDCKPCRYQLRAG